MKSFVQKILAFLKRAVRRVHPIVVESVQLVIMLIAGIWAGNVFSSILVGLLAWAGVATLGPFLGLCVSFLTFVFTLGVTFLVGDLLDRRLRILPFRTQTPILTS